MEIILNSFFNNESIFNDFLIFIQICYDFFLFYHLRKYKSKNINLFHSADHFSGFGKVFW